MFRKILGLLVLSLVFVGCGVTPPVEDTEKPTLTVTSPANNATVTTATLTVTGTAKDNTAVTKLSYILNGGTAVDVTNKLSSGNFSFDVALGSAGSKTIKVTASDAAGNIIDVTRTVTLQPTSNVDLTSNWKMVRTNDDPANLPAVLTMSLDVTDTSGTLSGNAYLFSEGDPFGRGSLLGTIEGTNGATGFTIRIVFATSGFLELTGTVSGATFSGTSDDANSVTGTFTGEKLTE